MWPLLVLGTLLAGAGAADITDEQYYRMLRLFSLEDREACARVAGDYCLGTFTLRPRTEQGHELFDIMLKYSQDDRNFNHTVLHRGYCVSTRCPDLASTASRRSSASSVARRFYRCVDREAEAYGLRASPLRLDSCETAAGDPPPDVVDWSFAAVVALIVVLNVVGTAYDILRNPDEKPNKALLAWSVRVNWRRLTATYDSDPRLTALSSVQGVKAFTLALVMLGHSMIVHNMSYIQNTRFFEQGNAHVLATFLHNGSVVVQGFVLVSAFLLAYNLLLLRDAGHELRLRMLPAALLHRLIRIVPLHMFMVGLSATWWSRGGAGAQWALLRAQRAACRRAWWAHALSLNNILTPDDKCLLQAWFLAADMQVFLVTAALSLWLAGRIGKRGGERGALRLLAGLIAGAVAGNFLIAYWLELKPIMLEMKPDVIRDQYVGSSSFKWLYAAPWGSLPAGLLGVWLAFLQRRLTRLRIRPDNSKIFRLAYTWFLPALFLWVLGGHLVRRAPAPVVALYAAVDRPGYVLIGAVGLVGFFHEVDGFWKRFFEWRGWQPLGRMSLAVMLVHWNWHLTHIALRTTLSTVSIFEVGGHWESVQIMSYATALPLHLCVEVPAHRSLQALLFRT